MTDFVFVYFFFLRTVIYIFFIGICTDTSVFEAVLNKSIFSGEIEKRFFFAGMKTEGKFN